MPTPDAYSDAWTAKLRAELGTGVDLDDAATRWQRYTDAGATDPLRSTILEVLSERLSTLTASPATFNVEGDYSQSTAANITALQAQLAALRADTNDDDQPDLPVVTLARLRPARRRGRTIRRWPI